MTFELVYQYNVYEKVFNTKLIMQLQERLIQKMFNGECSVVELRLLFDLLKEDSEDVGPDVMLELFEQLKNVSSIPDSKTARILERVKEKTQEDEEDSFPKPKIKTLSTRLNFMRIAATILFLAVAGVLVYVQFQPEQTIVESAIGGIKEINLPDGSIVTLNRNSTLTYSAKWKQRKDRVVQLEGEAYFQVQKQNKTKFQVITNDLIVEVLGTVFNVNTRQKTTKVFLQEGEVKLKLHGEEKAELYLEPGQEASYSIDKQELQQPKETAEEVVVSWLTGILVFEETPLQEIIEKLAAEHNFQFDFESEELSKKKYNLAIPHDNLEQSLQLTRQTTNLEIIQQENTIYIRKKTKGKEKE